MVMVVLASLLHALWTVVRAYLAIGCLAAAWMAFGLWWHGMSDEDVRRRAEASFEGRRDDAQEFGVAFVGSRMGAIISVLIFWPAIARDLVGRR